MVLRIFREDDLPLVNAWSTTRLSTKCTHRTLSCFFCIVRHRRVVSTALASNTLMCSGSPVHRHPATERHRHSFAGIPLRSL